MRTIAVTSRKGGSGKTTVAAHLALASYLRGRKCLVADADPQRSSSAVFKVGAGEGPASVESAGPKLFARQVAAAREGVDDLIIDTAAGEEHELAHAIVLADITALVIRPTFLDIAAVLRTAEIIQRLRKRGVLIVNQAPVSRDGVEPPMMRRALRALTFLGLPTSPVVLRHRSAYQTCLEAGRSVEETETSKAAAAEVAALWDFVERLLAAPPSS